MRRESIIMAVFSVRWLKRLYVFLLICPLCAPAFLNLEELNEMKYGIQILPDPVILGQTKTEEVMMVSSKYKQLYECRLPAQAVRFHQDPASEPDSEGYTGPDIPDLLSPMHNAPCLVKTKDWWTYEFCHGQHIRQYHLEDTEIKGDILFLGYYESEFDWNNETAKASKQHRLKRYHSQTYVNGSKCDINGNPRETEVRFVCEEGSGDYIARVDEPQSCRYVLTIHTSRTCQHPFLRPPSTAKPQGIVCQPALSAQQYMDYVKAQVSDTKRKVEQISEELRNLDEMLAGNEAADGAVEVTPEEISAAPSDDSDHSDRKDTADVSEDGGSEEAEDSDFWEGVTKPETSKTTPSQQESQAADDVDDSLTDSGVIDDGDEEKFNFKIITDPADLMKFVQHLKESNRKKAQNQAKSRDEKQTSDRVPEKLGEEEKDEDERLLQEFEDEMADLSVPSDQIEEIKEEMQKEFDNIINEAQQELETEGLKGEFDRTQATQTLETTLDKLLDHLEEKDVQDQEQQTAGIQRSRDPTRGSPSLAPKQPDQAADDHVKIKITKYKTGSSPDGEVKVQEMGEGDPQWQHIKDVVKEQLEKAGLKAEGKIEVKILTRKNAEEAGDQWLTEEDTKSFRELLINLLTGGTEEVYKEQKRQQELENNYKFVWGESQEESQSSSTSDSDDVDI
ncbi:protein OS-9 isoform X2 [Seriola lalandi dorsalis]|uniref:protein OS-9 isoform X2 n=1 Tax=Seriola lalandi dorsalis TaxID=1841481 RepID=UPI000C6F4A53|nr:protein OS-9 isoform X2 [Seriola lalandi dorsalis]XP_056243954.1 protein OS-9 isoform X2 [Seriola aureovittata]